MSEVEVLFQRFTTNILSLQEKNSGGKHNQAVEFVCRYLQDHYSQPDLGIEVMANQVHLSPSYLGKLFRGYKGVSFNDYLKSIRMERAKGLLLTTEDSVATISEKVGISNSSYFFLLFKNTYGISPAAFREQHSSESSKDPE